MPRAKRRVGHTARTEDHRVKLRDCLARALAPAQVEEVIELLDHLDEQDATGVQKIVALIAAPAAATRI